MTNTRDSTPYAGTTHISCSTHDGSFSHVCSKHKLILSRQTCVHGPGLVLHTLEGAAAGPWLHEQVQGAGRSCYHSPSPQPCRSHMASPLSLAQKALTCSSKRTHQSVLQVTYGFTSLFSRKTSMPGDNAEVTSEHCQGLVWQSVLC